MEWMKEQFRKEYVIWFIISTFIILGMTLIGINESLNTVTYEEANKTITEISQIRVSVSNIFFNNWSILLVSLIPILGIFYIIFVSYNTGWAYGCIGKYFNLSLNQTISLAFTNYIGVIEDLAYCLVLAEVLLIMYLLISEGYTVANERIVRHSLVIFLLSTLILFFSAIIEVIHITGTVIWV